MIKFELLVERMSLVAIGTYNQNTHLEPQALVTLMAQATQFNCEFYADQVPDEILPQGQYYENPAAKLAAKAKTLRIAVADLIEKKLEEGQMG